MVNKRVNFDELRNNNLKSLLLLFFFGILIAIFGVVIGLFWGNIYFGLIVAAIFGGIYSLVVFNSGDSMILKMSGAKPVTKKEYPYLYHTVEGLSYAAGVPVPKAYVIEDSALNAFATGRKPEKSAIVVTTGLLNAMKREELEGVIAHEMSHIKNNDIRTMMLAAVLVGVVILLSDLFLRSLIFGGGRRSDSSSGQGQIIMIVVGLALAILAPLIAQLIKLAVSRKLEYAADAGAAILTRYPAGLASALKKISNDPDPLVNKANKAMAHLFISTPFRKKKGFWTKMFQTHPPLDERIKRLEQM